MTSALPAAGVGQKFLTAVHDTYIERAITTDNGGATTFLVKRNHPGISSSGDRIGCLRFAVDGPLAAVDSASLVLTLTNYPGDGTTPFTFEVFGLPDGHPDEAFNEGSLHFANAANASTTLPGSLNPAGLTSLGTFTPAVASGATTVEVSGTALRDFIAANANTSLSFIIFRQTANGSLPSYFASSESTTLGSRPTLVVRTPNDAFAAATTAASSTLAGFPAANATDNLFNTRWSAVADSGSTKSSITLDLGSAQTANRLNFTAYQHGRSYKFESSSDNTTWSLVASDFRSAVGSDVNTLGQATNLYFQPRSARYFRLSSLTSLAGKSLSLWEVQLFNDSAAATILARSADLTRSTVALPNTFSADRVKRAVLDICLERAQASINAGDFTHAGLLMDDVDAKLPAAAAAMAAQASGLSNMRVLRPLLQTTTATNPNLKRINDGVTLFLATTDPAWDKNTLQSNVLEDFSLARTTGQQVDALFWAFAHPNSPLMGNDEVLRRLLRRSYAYLDAINVHGPLLPAGQLAGFYDDFAIAPASSVFRELPALYPGLVAANSTAEWNSAVATAANNLWAAYQNRTASWLNTDVAIAVELFNFGTPTQRPELLAKGQYFIDDVLTSGRMFQDGATGYIGTQNEAGGYQWTVAEYVARYFETTGNANAGLILQKMQWYGAINGRLADWWTSPAWKDAWNDNSGNFNGGETVAGTNPYVRAELDALIAGAASTSNWYGRPRVDIAWYQGGITPVSRPDYTVFDRNTQGPRAWYGRWNYSGTLRDIADPESGHYTLMGAQVADPEPNFRCNASLMGIFPRIRTTPAAGKNADNSLNESGHAWLTSKLAGDSTVSRDFSAMGASYLVHQYGSAAKGTEYDWTGRQVWLNLPDRVIGLLDIAPNANLSAYEVQGGIRLGFGGTAYSATKTLVATAVNAWDYGDLHIKLHDHNYADVTPEVYFFRSDNAPTTEITLRDLVDGASKITPTEYPSGTRRKFLAEVRPSWASGEVTVTEVADPGGLIGLDVENPATGRRYRVVYNPGTVVADYTPNLGWTGPVRIHPSGARHRPDWLPDPSGPLVSAYLAAGQVLTIGPKAHVVLEQSGGIIKANNTNALDQSSSWTNGPMTDGGIASWDATVTSSNTTSVGNGNNLAGIAITNPGGNVTINPGGAGLLALGSAGIDTSGSIRTLTLGAAIRLDAPQSWITGTSGAPASAQITATGVITGSGGLTLSAAADRGVVLTAANTFSGGLVLGNNSFLDYSASAVVAASGGLLTSTPFGTAATEKPAVALEAGAYLSLSDGGSGRGHTVFSLAGNGTVLNNTSGPGARTDTLTIHGGLKTSSAEFAGVIRDRDTTTFPTANPSLVTALTKAGGTTQVLSGNNSYSGALTNNGVLDIANWTGTLPAGLVNNGSIANAPRPEIFANWQTLSWPGSSDPDTTGPDADPDHDGTNNLLEWALGLDPNIPDGFSPAFKQGATLEYTYTRRKTAPGAATYQVEWSDGFSNEWSAAGVGSDPPVSLSTSSESIHNIIPDGPDGRRFIRLKVIKP